MQGLEWLLGAPLIVIGAVVAVFVILKIVGFRVIRPDQVGIVEKWWSPKGSLKDNIIALHGEAGFQPYRRGGWA